MYKLPLRAVHYFTTTVITLVTLIFALPSSAALLKFTYTSDSLPLSAAYYEGELWEYPEPIEPVSFSMSFSAVEQDLSLKPITTFLMDDFNFSFNSSYYVFDYPLRLSSGSYGRVSLNKAGEIVSWNLLLEMAELITPETDLEEHRVANRKINVVSRGGTNTCNCDLLTGRIHVHTWHYHWIQLAPLKFEFSNANQTENWTIENIQVPEPSLAGLCLSGLAVLLWCRRGNKKHTR